MNCRHCGKELKQTFIDLGYAPPSNAYLSSGQLDTYEKYFPLKTMVCDNCWLVQTIDMTSADELFSEEYAYFSSTSESWLEHSRLYTEKIIKRCGLNENSFVVELASNDGYLLKYFLDRNIPCLGIEPTESTANIAISKGIPVVKDFFTEKLSSTVIDEQKRKADLIIGNNVFAHVPDINDFTKGMANLLDDNGSITLEFPHLLNLIKEYQFDTIYHEHFSYLSLSTVDRIFREHGLMVYHVEELSTHGGSLRVYGCHDNGSIGKRDSVVRIIEQEIEAGLNDISIYKDFHLKAESIKNGLLKFLIQKKEEGLKVVAYGAAAKGNTLLNYAGIKSDLINEVYDASISKQNKFLPGSHIPILPPNRIKEYKPDLIMILPWNIKDEICRQLSFVKDWGGRFFYAIPTITYIED